MNSWEVHKVEFSPSEGIVPNETSMRILDADKSDDERAAEINKRIGSLSGSDGHVLNQRTKLTDEAKKDPGYKFLMMVAAYSRQKFGNVIRDRVSRSSELTEDCSGGACPFPRHSEPETKWLNSPEITGVVQISTNVYGHIKEAQMIVNNFGVNVQLKDLIEDETYAVPFARLVAIRISLSAAMTGLGNRRDRTFVRLHQEQSMLMHQFKRVKVKKRDWTRPVASLYD